jgi:hypothetical protein
MEYVKGVFMAVYAVYEADGYLPLMVTRTLAGAELMKYSNTEIVRYNHLTLKQVSALPYIYAKACEAIMEENNVATLQ